MFEEIALQNWKNEVQAWATTFNANADHDFALACATWLQDAEWRAAQGLEPKPKPVHLPVAVAAVDAKGLPTLSYVESMAVCPDLPVVAPLPAGVTEIGDLYSDDSGRRYAGAKDTMPKNAMVVKDGVQYQKIEIRTPFGLSKWYQPK